jgi:hypothetical protein
MNEDDDKLETFITTKEDDQRDVLIIAGVEIFLPSGRGEANTYVADATGRQQAESVKEDKEHILMSVPMEGEEHSTKPLDFFIQEDEQEMTAALESEAEEEENIIDFVGLCEELESLERRVEMQGMHIQQAKLEIDEGPHQHEELGKAETKPAEKLTGSIC